MNNESDDSLSNQHVNQHGSFVILTNELKNQQNDFSELDSLTEASIELSLKFSILERHDVENR